MHDLNELDDDEKKRNIWREKKQTLWMINILLIHSEDRRECSAKKKQ